MTTVGSIIITNGLFALGMLMLAIILTKRLGKAAVIAAVVAFVLGIAAAQFLVYLVLPHLATASVGMLTFVFYLLYGSIYVVSLALGRRFDRA